MALSKTVIKKPVTVLVIYILLAILGIFCASQLAIELIPDMEIPYVIVSTTYTGASPEEVNDTVTETLEQALSSVTGVKNLTASSSKGSSMISLEFEVGTDLDDASATIRDRIELVKEYLPSEAKSPVLYKMDMSMMPAMVLCASSDSRTVEELKQLVEDNVEPRLQQLNGVASTTVSGGRERAIKVQISKDRLKAYGLTFTEVAQLIAAQNMNNTIGTITESGLDYTITGEGYFESIDEIEDTVISYKATGSGMHQIKLGEIAEVYDGYKDLESFAYFDGKPAVAISVTKQSGANTVATCETVLKSIDNIKRNLPSDVDISVAYDSSEEISQSINSVKETAIEGGILAVAILLVFLRSIKSTLIIGISIPLAVVITLFLMYLCGFSLNLMTLAGLALGIGMLVDNSIVVLENIFSYRERGTKPTVAAVLGTQEMISAITSSTMTTLCVFLPLLMFQRKLGMIGQVFNGLTFTIVFSLLSSLVVAVTLVPVLAGHYLIPTVNKKKRNAFLRITDKFFDGMDNCYAAIVKFILKIRWLFILFIIALFALSIWQAFNIGYEYMPETASTELMLSYELPQGTSIEEMEKSANTFIDDLNSQLKGIKSSTLFVSGSSSLLSSGSNTATIMLMFYPEDEREPDWDNGDTAEAKLDLIKDKYPEAKISVSSSLSTSSMSSSDSIEVKIQSANLDSCREVANNILVLFKEKGTHLVANAESSLEDGLPQYSLIYDREKMYSLGLNVASVNTEVAANVNGMTCSLYHENGDNIDVVISLPDSDKTTLLDLEDITVSSPLYGQVPLSSFATFVETRGPLTISRENQSNLVTITADNVSGLPLNRAQREVQSLIEANIPATDDVIISYSGAYEDMITAIQTFALIIVVAILMVFAVMASQFESFLKPFIVLLCIPLALIGVVAIYTMTGNTLNVITAVGFLILVGIIVNNGIVLVDYIGLLQARGYALMDACVESARSRLRPILMTTLTTILGLWPMAFGGGEGTEMTQAIGQTVLGGLTFGTLMTLFLMPCVYYVFNSRKEKRKLKKLELERAEAIMEIK